jgi:hypothetical protein
VQLQRQSFRLVCLQDPSSKQASRSRTENHGIVVIFGDPNNGTAVGTVDPSKVLVICHDEDLICKGTWIVLAEHLDVSVFSGGVEMAE